MDVTEVGPADSTPDAGPEPDLTPRPVTDAPRRRRTRNPGAYVLLALILAAIGFVVFQGLNNAALYYRNADEAIADKGNLGTHRFRVQGTVLNDVVKNGNEVDFSIQFPPGQPSSAQNTIAIRHTGGDPPELFKPGIPVVLEGHWDASGAFFASDSILIKHTAEYKEQNPGHVASDAP